MISAEEALAKTVYEIIRIVSVPTVRWYVTIPQGKLEVLAQCQQAAAQNGLKLIHIEGSRYQLELAE